MSYQHYQTTGNSGLLHTPGVRRRSQRCLEHPDAFASALNSFEKKRFHLRIQNETLPMKNQLPTMIFLALFLALQSLLFSTCLASTNVNVMDLGAKGDGKVLDTNAVIAAFAICSSDPPPSLPCIINFPSPHKFLLSPFNVSSNTVRRCFFLAKCAPCAS